MESLPNVDAPALNLHLHVVVDPNLVKKFKITTANKKLGPYNNNFNRQSMGTKIRDRNCKFLLM